jgi:LysR family hydrogen peroxide-inducible transcriptional activator
MAILPSFQQLRFLCALAEQCHFGRAAESCAVTQSTLSGGIKELEARLGITLFERGHRHVMLTPLGKEIATRAQRLLVDAEKLVGLARNAQEPLSGPLRFGVIPTVGPYVLPSLLSHLGTALPKLKLYVREAPTAVLLDKLAGGKLDILLVAVPYELGDVETMEIANDPIVVAMPRNHPLGQHKVVSRDDLAREQLLLIEDGHCLRSHSLQACRIADPVRNEVFQRRADAASACPAYRETNRHSRPQRVCPHQTRRADMGLLSRSHIALAWRNRDSGHDRGGSASGPP